MAKHIVEENVVLTTFEANEASAKKVEATIKRLVNTETKEAIKAQRVQRENDLKKNESAGKASKKTADTVIRESNRSTRVVVRNNNKVKQSYRTAFSSDFLSSLERSFARLERLAVRLSVATGAFVYGLERSVKAQRDLFYAAERLEVPVEDINRYQYIVTMLGGSVEQALPSLEKFKNTLQDMALGRNAPALEIFGRLGLTQFDSTGRVKSVTQAINELAVAIRRLPSVSTQTNYLKKLGFDETEFGYFIHDTQQLNQEFTQLYSIITKGTSTRTFLDKLAVSSEQVYRRFFRLRTIADVLRKGFLANLNPRLIKLLDNLTQSILNNAEAIRRGLKGISDGAYIVLSLLAKLITTIGKTVVNFVDWYNSLDQAEKNLLKFAAAVGIFFKIVGTGMLASPFGRLLAAFTMLGLMIQDYLYYKKALEFGDDKYKYHYDWSGINDNLTQNFGFNIDDLDISGKIKAIGNALSFVGKKLAEIDPALRDFVITIGLVAAALLPIKTLLLEIGGLLARGTGKMVGKTARTGGKVVTTTASKIPGALMGAGAALAPVAPWAGALLGAYLALKPTNAGEDQEVLDSILQGKGVPYTPSNKSTWYTKLGDFLYDSASNHSILNMRKVFQSWNEPLGVGMGAGGASSVILNYNNDNNFVINGAEAPQIGDTVAGTLQDYDVNILGNTLSLNFRGAQ